MPNHIGVTFVTPAADTMTADATAPAYFPVMEGPQKGAHSTKEDVEQSDNRVTVCSTRLDYQIELRRQGRRKNVRHGGALCSICLAAPPAPNRRYCHPCNAAYERQRRRALKLSLLSAASAKAGQE
jgi:hypothetical protein